MADSWFQSILSGVIGASLTSAATWLKYRDDRQVRLRDTYAAYLSAVDRALRRSGPLYWQFRSKGPDIADTYGKINDIIAEVEDARARLELLETSESCLARLEALRTLLNELHDIYREGMTADQF